MDLGSAVLFHSDSKRFLTTQHDPVLFGAACHCHRPSLVCAHHRHQGWPSPSSSAGSHVTSASQWKNNTTQPEQNTLCQQALNTLLVPSTVSQPYPPHSKELRRVPLFCLSTLNCWYGNQGQITLCNALLTHHRTLLIVYVTVFMALGWQLICAGIVAWLVVLPTSQRR